MNSISTKELNTVTELRELISVFSLAFETEYDAMNDYLQKMLDNDATVILGVINEKKIVGGLVAFEMTPIHGSKEFYIYDIAIHPDYQKQGLGKRLIERLKEESKCRGIKTIFVEAESEDTNAVAFYRKIGGEEVAVNHFNFKIT